MVLVQSTKRIAALLRVGRGIGLHPVLELARVLVGHEVLAHHVVGLKRERSPNNIVH